MKTKLLLLFSVVGLFISCQPRLNEVVEDVVEDVFEDRNMDIQFEYIGTKYSSYLYLKHNDGTYYQFDDEDCYDDIIEQIKYACVVKYRCPEALTKEQIEYVLGFVKCLPIQDVDIDAQYKEILNAAYYDHKDDELFVSENGYGYRKYPWHTKLDDNDYIYLERETEEGDHYGNIKIKTRWYVY